MAPIALVSAYLDRLHEIRSTQRQTPELSYRAALENLLNAIGHELDTPVQATAELIDSGAGHPDFGFFEVKSGTARGGVEVKSPQEDVPQTADGSQVSRYVKQYGYVLVTNYRDFLLVVNNGGGGKPIVEGRCTLAANAEAFWRCKPHALAKDKGEELVDFLIGVIKRSAPIARPADLADDLARHAREAKRRLEHHDISALAPLKEAMENALGLHFAGKEGEDFFRSSLVQTLFYGLFSGWMLWREGKHQPHTFDWNYASEYLALPLIGDLYEEIARPKKLGDLGLREPLDWSTASLNRVEETAFFKNFDQDHAITLFYEPFLQAFDPELRKQLGVWYTPPEIVQYMVGRVDQLLRSELGIEDGLADKSVYVLDPCCGTGSYLLEVGRKIHQTLLDQGHGQVAALETKKALTSRVFGFEILPAPYVVSHLQLGVMLRQMGTKLSTSQRAGVYLTNALTGWEPPKEPKQMLAFPFLEAEQDAAAKVKHDAPILVILGNPPYNGFGSAPLDEERDLIQPYREALHERWGIRKQNHELYVRFYRLAERRLAEAGTRGLFCFISNHSWLNGLPHVIMRERLLARFQTAFIDNLHGDRKASERSPDGMTSETVFAVAGQSPGIQVGTAIAAFVAKQAGKETTPHTTTTFRYRDFDQPRAEDRRASLLTSLTEAANSGYHAFATTAAQRWSLLPAELSDGWAQWHKLVDIFGEGYKGVQPGRGGALVSVDRDTLLAQFRDYFDRTLTDADVAERYPELMAREAGYAPLAVRAQMLAIGPTDASLTRIAWLPFDYRWAYFPTQGKLVHRRRPEFAAQVGSDNMFLGCTQKPRKGAFPPPVPVRTIGSYYLFDPYAAYFPLRLTREGRLGADADSGLRPKLLEEVCTAVDVVPFAADAHTWTGEARMLGAEVFYHVLAILWSPAYRKENEAALRQDWPRVPIPADAAILESSATLGRTIADLLLPDKPVPGVTTGKLRDELKRLAIPSKVGGSPIEEPADTKVDAGWGFRGQKNAVMCGKGVVTDNKDHDGALNIWINDRVYWANVPADVWAMTIGGYPVVKKWLSYREHKVLGRALKGEELTYITEVVRRLKALLLLGDELDGNYRKAAAAEQVKLASK